MRHNLKLCRLCAKYHKNIPTIQIFERSRKYVLLRIFQLTGIKLKNDKNIPSVMCLDCEMELNRAYEFRERCFIAQTYFSSPAYNNQISDYQEIGDDYESDETESTLVKLEVMPCTNENQTTDFNLENKPKIYLKNETCGRAETSSEFIAVNKEIIHTTYEVDEVELLDQDLDYAAHKSVFGENTKDNIEIYLDGPKDEWNRLEDDKSKPVINVLKSDYQEKTTQEVKKLSCKASKERKSKARIYICDQCGNNFKYRSHFYSHIKRHTGIKPLQCEVCPNKFFTEGELKRHMRRHTGERPFPCKHCQRRFTDYSTRIKHERTHTNERPFECSQCGKAFTTSYVLKNHMLVHTGERSFECTLCKKSFQRQTHLIVHTRSLAHKQNVEREQQKIEDTESFPSQISAEDT